MQLLTASVQQLQPSTLSMSGCPVHFCAAHCAHALFLSASGTCLTRRRQPVQSCVKHLGQLRAKRASKPIRKLFDAPPDMTIHPIFQNHCLDAIAAIDGAAACGHFREQLRHATHHRV